MPAAPSPTGPPPGVVRVTNALGGALHVGSATVVANFADRDAVLTCNHLFSEGVGRITVFFPDGRAFGANLLKQERRADLAVLEIAFCGVPAVPPASADPPIGRTLIACGFGRGDFRTIRGTLLGYAAGPGPAMFELSGAARSGDSGGPVLDAQGRLVGVVWGTDGRVIVATSASAVTAFLRSALDSLTAKASRSRPPVRVLPEGPVPEEEPDDASQSQGQEANQPRADSKPADSRPRKEETPRPGLPSPKPVRKPVPRRPGVADSAPWDILAWTGVLLCGTSPLSLALLWYLRYRRIRRAAGAILPTVTRYSPLNDRYAAQLNDVFALCGRSSTADATLGREYDRELENAETGSDPVIAKWAKQLRRRVASKFYRIHDDDPLPAEPL